MTDDHRSLHAAMRDWAHSIDGPELIRVAEAGGAAPNAWSGVLGQGITTIAVPESLGGGGGTVLDLAVAIEGCAHELLPGPVLGTALAATVLAGGGASAALAAIVS